MFQISTHNVTEVTNARINQQDGTREGWVVISFNAQTYSWSHDEEQEDVGGEYTLFFRDLEKGLSQLREALDKGERQLRKDQAEAIKNMEASNATAD